MIAIRSILCPVDFSNATGRQVELAAGLARRFGARLVLHHNNAMLAPGAGVGWMWSGDSQDTSQEHVGQRLESLVNAHAPGLEVELRLTEGPPSAGILAVSDAVQASLIVLSTHQATTDDHTSVTEQIIARAHRPVLALHDAGQEPGALRLDEPPEATRQIALVPTDLSPESRAAVDFGFELARVLPLGVHLLHYLNHGGMANESLANDALKAIVPDDLLSRTRLDVREGDPGHGIVQTATALGAACIVMGAHTRSPLRRWLSRDTSRAVLHDAHCPVWYVPGNLAA